MLEDTAWKLLLGEYFSKNTAWRTLLENSAEHCLRMQVEVSGTRLGTWGHYLAFEATAWGTFLEAWNPCLENTLWELMLGENFLVTRLGKHCLEISNWRTLFGEHCFGTQLVDL